jgi:NADH-quinone oxidoreductase subunit D
MSTGPRESLRELAAAGESDLEAAEHLGDGIVAERLRVGTDPGIDHELLTINFGPHHPATHGVLRLLVALEGEVVREMKPFMGYVHTGIEKNCEDKSYWKVIPLVERMDYLA